MARLAPTSTPRVGSSAISTRGSRSSIRANSSFCWLPPDSVPAGTRLAPRPDVELAEHLPHRARSSRPRDQAAPAESGKAGQADVLPRPSGPAAGPAPGATRGSWRRPAAQRRRGLPRGRRARPRPPAARPSAPLTVPAATRLAHGTARASSVRPAPTSPARPTISPPAARSETSLTPGADRPVDGRAPPARSGAAGCLTGNVRAQRPAEHRVEQGFLGLARRPRGCGRRGRRAGSSPRRQARAPRRRKCETSTIVVPDPREPADDLMQPDHVRAGTGRPSARPSRSARHRGERAQDLHLLLIGGPQTARRERRRRGRSPPGRRVRHSAAAAHAGRRKPALRGSVPRKTFSRDRQRGHDRQFLGDAVRSRGAMRRPAVSGSGLARRRAAAPRVRRDAPGDDLAKSRLACAVLARRGRESSRGAIWRLTASRARAPPKDLLTSFSSTCAPRRPGLVGHLAWPLGGELARRSPWSPRRHSAARRPGRCRRCSLPVRRALMMACTARRPSLAGAWATSAYQAPEATPCQRGGTRAVPDEDDLAALVRGLRGPGRRPRCPGQSRRSGSGWGLA